MLQCNINASTEHEKFLKNINRNGNAYEYKGMINLIMQQTKRNRRENEKKKSVSFYHESQKKT